MPVANVRSKWESGNLVFTKVGTGATTGITFGEDTKGLDFKVFGDTTGKYFMWDQSADKLEVKGTVDADSVVADAYTVGSTAGATFDGEVTNITVANGIVTAAS